VTLHITRRVTPRCEFTGERDANNKPVYRRWMEDVTGSMPYGGKAKRTVSYGSDYLFPVQPIEPKEFA